MFEAPEKQMTLDEFLAFVQQQPDDGPNYELHEGELTSMPPSKTRQGVIAMLIGSQILNHVQSRKLGYVAGADAGFKIPPRDFYAPDAAFYSHESLPDGLPSDDYVSVAPDLAVEVVSASDQSTAHGKVMRYLELGTRLAWVVYPNKQSVDVYRPTDDGGVTIHTLRLDGTLQGGDVLPGFTLPVKNIFAP
jgi:Uma2 family endonuclease